MFLFVLYIKMENRKDKSNELTVLSDNTTTQRRFIIDRFDRNNISEKRKRWLSKRIRKIT